MIEEIVPGLKREWVDDGTIIIYTLESTDHEVIDTWADTVTQMINNWSSDKPYLVLHDASQIFLTPHLRQRADEIAKLQHAGVRGSYAVVLSETVVGLLMKQFVDRNLARNETGRIPHTFTSREEALNWLREIRTELEQQPPPSQE